MGSFNFENNKKRRQLYVTLEGLFSSEDAIRYLDDFNEILLEINPKQYKVIFDSNNLKIAPQEAIPMLEQCFTMYKQIGFKKVIFKFGERSLQRMQADKVAKEVGLEYEPMF